MWVSLKHKKPKPGIYLITRSPGYEKNKDCFEDWRKWKIDILSYNPPVTHWWNGLYDFDKAVKSWPMQEILEDS